MLAAVLAALTANVRTQIVTVLKENAAVSAQVSKYEYFLQIIYSSFSNYSQQK